MSVTKEPGKSSPCPVGAEHLSVVNSKGHIEAQRRSRQMHGICGGRAEGLSRVRFCYVTNDSWQSSVSSLHLVVGSLQWSLISSSNNAPSGLHVGNKGARKILSLPCRRCTERADKDKRQVVEVGRTSVGCA